LASGPQVRDDVPLELGDGMPEDVIDGEVIDVQDVSEAVAPPVAPTPGPAQDPPPASGPTPPSEEPTAGQLRRFHAALRDAYAFPEYIEDKTARFDEAKHVLLAECKVESSKDLTPAQLDRIVTACNERPAYVRTMSGLPETWGEGP
jgi:hypothetical protein